MRTGRFPISVAIAVAGTVACAAFVTASAPPIARAGATAPRPEASAAQSSTRAADVRGSGTGTVGVRGSSRPATSGAPVAPSTLPPTSLETIPWPEAAEAAVTVSGGARITTHGASGPVPIASLAKVMTAYVILTDHPLSGSSQGPVITVTDDDAALYAADAAAGGSVVEVKAGEQLTERQALEAMLLHSANNLAVLLADWDARNVPGFLGRMNASAARLGLASTHYADPAGVDQDTVSTAADQVRLAVAALGLSVFASIVVLPSAVVPVAGSVVNYDTMLGVDGIVGVKTGYTDAAGGTMLVAARTTAHGSKVLIVAAILGVSGGAATAFGRTLDAADQLVVGVERWLQG
jgi:D-alanyl-D-alanine carboxypeptidase (penicillin-binding protein 5/6)